ncbi:hypothetical protein [Flavobacterium wongokense]|uniref:hypothetical protein n=1 Tax=Flavobacterium wongokense TaxID=2910674 RepID=UPI001F2B9558|nr:hypothetical protein [Flavobacterium sp. WG47]MCF6131434.1 hypothetical protein [Flavobacterium sp. WG47]
MKSLVLLVVALLSINVYPQKFDIDAAKAIFLKDGSKIIPKQNDVRNDPEDNCITYWNEGSSWAKYIKYKDLDYVTIGNKLFKTFEFKQKGKTKKEKPIGMFVLIETNEYRLLAIDYVGGAGYFTIIDNDDLIIESKGCAWGKSKKDIEKQNEIVGVIKKYFSNLEEEMGFLEYCKSKDDGYSNGLIQYLKEHSYKKYN